MIVRVTSVDKTNLPESTELALVSVTASIETLLKCIQTMLFAAHFASS